MIYKDFSALCVGIYEGFDKGEDITKLRVLMYLYQDALRNPPDGVIGVGAITYAEQKLVEAQKDAS